MMARLPARPSKRYAAAVAVALTAALMALGVVTVMADSAAVDFESYTAGVVHGQDGWMSAGAAGSGCAVYDHTVVVNGSGAPASFGTQSLRMSNAITSGCFGDQTFSKPLTDEAGETSAVNSSMSGGIRQKAFAAQWDFASTVPGAEQPGLSVVASPDRGDGARMSWIQMTDTPSGLEVNFYDYVTGWLPSPCCVGFRYTTVASGLDRTVPHTIKVVMNFVDGPTNDVVDVYIDGALVHTGTSWEDYFRDSQPAIAPPTVDSVLFRTGGAAAPATSGNGFLIDNLTLRSWTPPTDMAQCKNGGWATLAAADGTSFKSQGDCVSYVASAGRAEGNP